MIFGIGTTIKAVAILIVVLVVFGGVWHISNLKADLAISQANNEKLEDGIKSQQELILKMQQDMLAIQNINNELQVQNEKQRQDVQNLSNKFNSGNRDFGAYAAAKPELVEKLVNRGTVNVLRCIELASGSPLNEKEINAKTPSEANRECPSLIDSDFKPIIN